MSRKATFLGIVATMLMLSGCATIFSKSDYPVSINSIPDQMSVVVMRSNGDTVFKGSTPATVTLGAKKGYFKGERYTIRLMRGDRAAGETTLQATIDGWYFANLLAAGVIGMLIVDPITGRMWALDTEVTIVAVGSSATVPDLDIREISTLTQEERDRLVALDTPKPRD